MRSIGIQCNRSFLSYDKFMLLPEREFQFYTGVTKTVFNVIFDFLGGEEVLNSLKYKYNQKTPKRFQWVKFTAQDKLLMTLLRLRRGIALKDLSELFSIKKEWACKVFYAWIRLMSIQFSRLDDHIFVSAEVQNINKPKCFSPFPNLRVIIDATEMKIQRPRNLQQQGNTYSNYKAANTMKFLIGISCYGGLSFISEGFEGSISDRKLLLKSGILQFLIQGDSVMADRGFDAEDILNDRGVDLIIPAFLGTRSEFTARELLGSKIIASARIHVETFIGRVKQFKLLRCTIPNNQMLPYYSDIVKVCAHLVNFNAPFINFDQE
ncbi:hypothetical protein FOCC_FOCC008359 [Frankliniella occidentalis]|nr:hypothetical protein FOCC_FOCC008359 [Frankliniella occidentalis]